MLEVASRRGARPLVEEHPSLPAAMHQAEEEAAARGLDALAVVLPDTPLLTPAGLTRALHTLGPVVLGPSADGAGTNLLLRRGAGGDRIARFGPDSFRKHVQAAAEADLPGGRRRSRRRSGSTWTSPAISSPCSGPRPRPGPGGLMEMDAAPRLQAGDGG